MDDKYDTPRYAVDGMHEEMNRGVANSVRVQQMSKLNARVHSKTRDFAAAVSEAASEYESLFEQREKRTRT